MTSHEILFQEFRPRFSDRKSSRLCLMFRSKKAKLQAVLYCDFGWSLDKLLPNNVANIDILKRPTMRRQYTMMPDIESYT